MYTRSSAESYPGMCVGEKILLFVCMFVCLCVCVFYGGGRSSLRCMREDVVRYVSR